MIKYLYCQYESCVTNHLALPLAALGSSAYTACEKSPLPLMAEKSSRSQDFKLMLPSSKFPHITPRRVVSLVASSPLSASPEPLPIQSSLHYTHVVGGKE